MNDEPAGLDEFLKQAPANATSSDNEPAGLDAFISAHEPEDQSAGQQLQAGAEGVARGATLGLSDYALTGFHLPDVLGGGYIGPGLSPEAIKHRQETFPLTSTASTIGGAVAGLMGPEELALPVKGLQIAGKGLGTVLGGTKLAKLAGAGLEGLGFGAGNVISDSALGDPDLNAQKIASHLGLGFLFGIGGGLLGQGAESIIGKYGSPKGSVADGISAAADEANKSASTAEAVANNEGFKQSHPQVQAAAGRLGLPLNPGQNTANPFVEKATDSLINGAPTFAAVEMQKAYGDAYQGLVNKISDILPINSVSKNDLGVGLKNTLTSKISDIFEPFKDLYGAISDDTKNILLDPPAVQDLSKGLIKFADDEGFGVTSPAYKLAENVQKDLEGIRSIDQLRKYQSGLSQRFAFGNASPAENRLLGIVQDKIDGLLKSSIDAHVNFLEGVLPTLTPEVEAESGVRADDVLKYTQHLKTLSDVIDQTDAQYAPLRSKLAELSSWLGKNKVQGPRHAIQFIENLEPEELTQKLTSTKYANLSGFLDQNFPDISAMVKEYQKGVLRDASTTNGVLNPKIFLKKVSGFQPEIKKSIFLPDELQRINDVNTYLGSFPRNFNPSGTSGMGAFRHFFENPFSAGTSNARDYGIKKYIEMNGQLPSYLQMSPEALGTQMSQTFNHLNGAHGLIDKTDSDINGNIDYLLKGE